MCAGIRDAANVAWKIAEGVAAERAAEARSAMMAQGQKGASLEAEALPKRVQRSSPRRRKASPEPQVSIVAALPGGSESAAAPPAAPLPAATTAALLGSYQLERQGHLRGVIGVALAMGRLVALRMPGLRHIRNAVVGAAYHCPATRPFFKVR